MIEKVKQLISSKIESEIHDFKRDPYKLGNAPKKNELLKDVIAFANHPSKEDKYIIIGVSDSKEVVGIEGQDSLVRDTDYKQFLDENIEPRINFSYHVFTSHGVELAYFKIYDNLSQPYLFKKDVTSSRAGQTFCMGSGFIRDDTLVRRLERQDFEKMYLERFKKRDRKDGLRVEQNVGYHSDSGSGFKIYYLDLNVENISNQSLGFNIELSVPRLECTTLNNLMNKVGALSQSLEICSEERGDREIFSTCLRDNGYNIHMDQRSKQINIFNRQIVFLNTTIVATLTLSSDHFVDGPIVMDLSFTRPDF